MRPIDVPPGLTLRALRAGDAEAVTALVAACEERDDGAAEIALEDVVADWSRPGVDLARQSIGVFDAGRLVAYAYLFEGRADAAVDPAYRGRGIGSTLMRWTWDAARAAGRRDVGQTVSDNRTDAAALLEANGYEPRWTSWILRIEIDTEPSPQALPPGYAVRDFVAGADDRAVHDLIETAFDWPGREPWSFEAWQAWMTSGGRLAAWASPLIVVDGRIVGAALAFDYGADVEGWIQQLAVERAHRGRGLGRALLFESFRRFFAAGRRRCGLSTDSRTGALDLYQHVGMVVRRSYTRWSTTL